MAQQVQAKQRELQSKLEAMLASVEDERLRPMRKQGFLAMAKCCDLSDPSASGVLANARRHRRRDARRERRRHHTTPSTRRVARDARRDRRRRDRSRPRPAQDRVPAVPPEGAAARAARFASSTRGVKRLPEPAPARDRDVPGRRQGRFAGGVRSDLLTPSSRDIPGVASLACERSHHTTGGYSDQNRAQNVFNTCVGKVFDAHASMLGDVKKRIEKGLR